MSSAATTQTVPFGVERILPAADIEMFRGVHQCTGCGPVHDRQWWTIESRHLSTDWDGIYALRDEIIKKYETAGMALGGFIIPPKKELAA